MTATGGDADGSAEGPKAEFSHSSGGTLESDGVLKVGFAQV
ncbi:hypothetical protein [Algibacillus agarilyticus]|nr:hypothetical protein [Algibacillus agarilyticus]